MGFLVSLSTTPASFTRRYDYVSRPSCHCALAVARALPAAARAVRFGSLGVPRPTGRGCGRSAVGHEPLQLEQVVHPLGDLRAYGCLVLRRAAERSHLLEERAPLADLLDDRAVHP